MTRYDVDYDAIAETYDDNPVRQRGPDPNLAAFLEGRGLVDVRVLDIACGTGIQLIADRPVLPTALLVGLDFSHGMLRMAINKRASVHWVQGDGMKLPFGDESFDFISNQFAYHHFGEPGLMVDEAFRVCRPGGRLVLINIAPREMEDTALYHWFPESLSTDLAAHPPQGELVDRAKGAGFRIVDVSVRMVGGPERLSTLAQKYSQKESCSQLNAMSEQSFNARLKALLDAARREPSTEMSDHTALLKLVADKPA